MTVILRISQNQRDMGGQRFELLFAKTRDSGQFLAELREKFRRSDVVINNNFFAGQVPESLRKRRRRGKMKESDIRRGRLWE